jgi:ABC-2 type transport system ATP-binding protein
MIEVNGVSKRYGDKQVLSEVSLTARDGEVTGFVGPNGAGKSTLMKAVLGLVAVDEGTALIDDEPFVRSTAPAASLGAMISAEWLPGRFTPRSLLTYACDAHGFDRSRVAEVLADVGLESVAGSHIGSFSLGMRQRIGLGLAIVGRPRNLMLDEPVNGLDPSGVIWLRTLLRRYADEGTAVLLSSHLMSELALVADRVVMLSQGRVVRQGTVEELGAGQRRVYVESAETDELLALLVSAGHRVERSGKGLQVTGADPVEVGRVAFEQGSGVSHLSVVTDSLEEVFLLSTEAQYTAETS